MTDLDAITNGPKQTAHCRDFHTIRVFRNSDGSYHATCQDCDWWSTIPHSPVIGISGISPA